MPDLADVYDSTRRDIAELVRGLDEDALNGRVPATPEWSVRDVVAHLTGDVACALVGDFPREFFESFGSEQGVISLNEWTHRQVAERRSKPLSEVLEEWEGATQEVKKMMRGEREWPGGILPFVDHVLLADIATHQQDVYGALGIVRDRESAQVRIGASTYIGGVALRIGMDGGPPLRFAMENKEVAAGGDDPNVTVRASRFELFRALSGRRNPDQVRAFEWSGDPTPFLRFFYPYGIRQEALNE